MIINTKFKVGDLVFYILDNEIREDHIIVIQSTVTEFGITNVYYLKYERGLGFKENKLFPTEEQLKESL